jgi:hypothetical protein
MWVQYLTIILTSTACYWDTLWFRDVITNMRNSEWSNTKASVSWGTVHYFFVLSVLFVSVHLRRYSNIHMSTSLYIFITQHYLCWPNWPSSNVQNVGLKELTALLSRCSAFHFDLKYLILSYQQASHEQNIQGIYIYIYIWQLPYEKGSELAALCTLDTYIQIK